MRAFPVGSQSWPPVPDGAALGTLLRHRQNFACTRQVYRPARCSRHSSGNGARRVAGHSALRPDPSIDWSEGTEHADRDDCNERSPRA